MINRKNSISALKMQRQLGYKRYKPIWTTLCKVITIGNGVERCKLDELVSIDNAFFRTHSYKNKGNSKSGRGTTKHADVLVICSIDSRKEGHKYVKANSCRKMKMMVMTKQKAAEVEQEVLKNIEPIATIKTDSRQSYSGIKNLVASYLRIKVMSSLADKVLTWVPTTISNSKKQTLGIHTGVKNILLQNYLNAFFSKKNQRSFGFQIFERVLVAAVETPCYTSSFVRMRILIK